MKSSLVDFAQNSLKIVRVVSSNLDFSPKPRAKEAVSFYMAFLLFFPLKFTKQPGTEISWQMFIFSKTNSCISSTTKVEVAFTFWPAKAPNTAQ